MIVFLEFTIWYILFQKTNYIPNHIPPYNQTWFVIINTIENCPIHLLGVVKPVELGVWSSHHQGIPCMGETPINALMTSLQNGYCRYIIQVFISFGNAIPSNIPITC